MRPDQHNITSFKLKEPDTLAYYYDPHGDRLGFRSLVFHRISRTLLPPLIQPRCEDVTSTVNVAFSSTGVAEACPSARALGFSRALFVVMSTRIIHRSMICRCSQTIPLPTNQTSLKTQFTVALRNVALLFFQRISKGYDGTSQLVHELYGFKAHDKRDGEKHRILRPQEVPGKTVCARGPCLICLLSKLTARIAFCP